MYLKCKRVGWLVNLFAYTSVLPFQGEEQTSVLSIWAWRFGVVWLWLEINQPLVARIECVHGCGVFDVSVGVLWCFVDVFVCCCIS